MVTTTVRKSLPDDSDAAQVVVTMCVHVHLSEDPQMRERTPRW